ncbi:MAG: hypothetical protein KDI42_03990 [Gammaproteobacteria bacterium]|nr:hypothetical protein [Gammaproteobacteria bacterium]
MALRIKSSWHQSDREGNEAARKGLEEQAGALAFIAWRIALDRAKNLHGEDYLFNDDMQRIAVICEYLAYEVALIDRMVFDGLSYEEREVLMNALGQRVGDHVQDNAQDLFGQRDYKSGFIDNLNDRLNAYAEFGYGDGGPSYSFNHYLGKRVQALMGVDQTNKWSIDQAMEIDAPETYKRVRKAVEDLMMTAE